MDINEKLDKIIDLLEQLIENQQVVEERDAELLEAVHDLGLPGSGFSTERYPEE